MKNKKADSTKISYVVLFTSIILLLIASLSLFKPNLTGLVIYESSLELKNWTFDNPADYKFDSALINVSNSEVKLIAKKDTSSLVQTTQQDFESGALSNLNSSALPGSLILSSKPNWWDSNYKYRKQLNITNKAASSLELGYSVMVVLDTQSLASSGKLKPDCSDLRIVHSSGSNAELERVNETSCSSASTEVWFKTAKAINALSYDDSYYIYYGNPSANSPSADRTKIYLLWDDFSSNTLGSYMLGDWLCYHGDCKNFKNFTYSYGRVFFNTTDNHDSGLRLGMEARDVYSKAAYSITNSYPTDSTVGIGLRWSKTNKYYTAHVSGGNYPSPAIAKKERTKYIKESDSSIYHPKDGAQFTIAFAAFGENLRLWYNGVESLSGQDDEFEEAGDIVFEAAQSEGYLNNILLRKYVEPEPLAQVGNEETYYEKSGNFTSPAYKSEYPVFESLDFGSDIPQGASLKFKVRSALTQNELSTDVWHSPHSENDYNWIQYTAFFESDGTSTPVLNDVSVVSSTTSYPSNASVETLELLNNSILSFDSFLKSDLLNGQDILYYYSLDSGASWALVPDSNSLVSLNSSGKKIMAKAVLLSNGSNTPIIYSFGIYYKAAACVENWSVNYGECLQNDKKLLYYLDKNECGTTSKLPPDNSTYLLCDYCAPKCGYGLSAPKLSGLSISKRFGNIGDIINLTINVSGESSILSLNLFVSGQEHNALMNTTFYSSNGSSYEFSIDTKNLTQGIYFLSIEIEDSNKSIAKYSNLEALALLPSAKAMVLNNSINFAKEQKTRINFSQSKAMLEFIISEDIQNSTVLVAESANNTKSTLPNASALGRYLDIVLDNAARQNLTSFSIKMYYTDEEVVNARLDENSLSIYYFNDTSMLWQELNTTVNTTEKSLTVTVGHASTYGVFGSQQSTQASPSADASSASGSAGPSPGGGTTTIIRQEETPKVKIEEKNTQKTAIAEAPNTQASMEKPPECRHNPVLKFSENVSFVENEFVVGIVENNGDCKISKIDLEVSENIRKYLDIVYSVDNLDKNRSLTFIVSIKNFTDRKKSFIEGFSIKTTTKSIKSIGGELLFSGLASDGTQVARKMKLNADIGVVENVSYNRLIGLWALGAAAILASIMFIAIKARKKNIE